MTSLNRYYQYTGKEQGPLIEDRARKVRFELYKQFRAISKTASALKAEIAGLGYAIKRRLGKDGKPVDEATEIKLRVRSLKFLSVSFLFKAWKGAEDGQQGLFYATTRASAQIGSARVSTKVGVAAPYVSLTSLLQGVVVQNQEHGIADRALLAQAQDMEEYLARKHEEQLQKLFSGLAAGLT